MTTTTKEPAALGPLPPVSVLKTQAAFDLLDDLYARHREQFGARMSEQADIARRRDSRPVGHTEAMSMAVANGPALGIHPDQIPEHAAAIQASGLRMQTEPDGREVLFSAIGTATSAAFALGVRFVLLIEMNDDDLELYTEDGSISVELDRRAKTAGRVSGRELRARADRAWQAFVEEWQLPSGEALARLMKPVWGALMEAANTAADQISRSSTHSVAHTGGDVERSSTTPGGVTPVT